MVNHHCEYCAIIFWFRFMKQIFPRNVIIIYTDAGIRAHSNNIISIKINFNLQHKMWAINFKVEMAFAVGNPQICDYFQCENTLDTWNYKLTMILKILIYIRRNFLALFLVGEVSLVLVLFLEMFPRVQTAMSPCETTGKFT